MRCEARRARVPGQRGQWLGLWLGRLRVSALLIPERRDHGARAALSLSWSAPGTAGVLRYGYWSTRMLPAGQRVLVSAYAVPGLCYEASVQVGDASLS
jgi:hypothetical protein